MRFLAGQRGGASRPRKAGSARVLPLRTSVRWGDGIRIVRLMRRSIGDMREKTFVILGTSHYGEPDKFGLTRKPFVTPLGETAVAQPNGSISLASQRAAVTEDYCHSRSSTRSSFRSCFCSGGLGRGSGFCRSFVRIICAEHLSRREAGGG